jgi:hypothetical protein
MARFVPVRSRDRISDPCTFQTKKPQFGELYKIKADCYWLPGAKDLQKLQGEDILDNSIKDNALIFCFFLSFSFTGCNPHQHW